MITTDLYLRARQALVNRGHQGEIDWAESVGPPATPEVLAAEYSWVVVNSGMKNTVARTIFDRVWPIVTAGGSASSAFGHTGKTAAIDVVWRRRDGYLAAFRAAVDKLAWCAAMPWIGKITKYHLAKNLGVDVAKPDRWLVRLAEAEGATVEALCARLAAATGDRVGTVDLVLWRACVLRLLVPGAVEQPAAAVVY